MLCYSTFARGHPVTSHDRALFMRTVLIWNRLCFVPPILGMDYSFREAPMGASPK